jgi:gliding motility-associated-like protein
LDITGDKITVEATFNRTAGWSGPDLYQGDLVSKHEGPNDCNYLLRPGSAEITTTNGYYKTPEICEIKLNKTYHAAMVYDGSTLKFYRNGFLMSQIAASGDLYQNDWETQIGLYFHQAVQENLIGYINEVRIWKITRTQAEIRMYMNQQLPNPQATPGLLAYYRFDNLLNKQGNAAWNGSLGGGASVNQTNPNCAFVADSCAVLCPTPPKYDFGFTQNVCDPLSVQFNANVSNVQSYEWSFGNGQKNAINSDPTLRYDSDGTYSVKLKIRYNNTCYDSLEKAISVSNNFDGNIILNSDTAVCVGDSILVRTNEKNISQCWRSSSGVDLPRGVSSFVTPTKTTTYKLQVEHKGSNLVVNGDFSSGDTAFNSEYKSSNSGFNAGVYSVGSNITSWHPAMAACNDHTTVSGNMMMVNGADQLNVSVWTQKVSVKPNTSYIFSAWVQTITTINPAQLQFSINGVTIGNIFNADPQSCVWKNVYQTWNSGNSSVATISVVNMSPEYSGNDFALDDIFFGEYSIRKDSFKVIVNPLPIVRTVSDTNICVGQSYMLNTTGAALYSWSPADGLTNGSSSGAIAMPNTSTTYVVTGKDQNGCSGKDTVVVSVKGPTVNLGADTLICPGQVLVLDASNDGAVYNWSNGLITKLNEVDAAGAYSVAVTKDGCTSTDTILVELQKPPNFAVSPAQANICIGERLEIVAFAGDSFEWFDKNGSLNQFGSRLVLNPSSASSYGVVIKQARCDFRDSLVVDVFISPAPTISLSKSNDVTCAVPKSQLIAEGGVAYRWWPSATIKDATVANPIVAPTETTWYKVEVQGYNGCYATDSIQVEAKFEDPGKFLVPNAFTPNGDGKNDCFGVSYWGNSKIFDLLVFNRWGQVVFHTSNKNDCWDGRYKGVLQPNEVFVYYIKTDGVCGTTTRKGTVTLIK